MEGNNWRPTQADPNMGDAPDWRTQLQADSRQRIVNKIMDTLKRHLPISGPEGLLELKKIAVRFEEKIYHAATSQADYLRKISLKMLTMETKSNTGVANALQPNPVVGNQNPADQASHSMQSQVRNQGQPQMSLANQSQARQQLLSQNIQDPTASGGVQNGSSLTSALPSVTGLTPSTMSNAIGQSSNLQSISGISQNSVGQSIPSNMFSNQQRQMQGRQHPQQVVSQPNQQQLPNSQQYMFQHHQNQLMKQKLQQGNMQPSLMQSHMQQQQNLLQATQLQSSQQSSQQSLMQMSSSLQSSQSTPQQTQPSIMQTTSHSGFQQNQQPSAQQSASSVLQQHPQSVLRQQPQSQQSLHQQSTGLHQQQTSIPQQQQHQPLAGQQQNTTNVQQQNQLIGQQNNVSDLQQNQQQLQQQQRLIGQQNSLTNLQQQQLLGQQNNLSNLNQQQLGSQNAVGLHQQQLIGGQSGVSNMQTHQSSGHMLSQQAKVGGQQQQMAQTSSTLMQMPGQQSQSQPLQQQLMPQLQSQSAQFQQQLGLQSQSNPMQRDMQQRLNSSGIPLQNVNEQKQIQSQRMLPEASSTSIDSTSQTGLANSADWQEEVYQKIKTMKEMYYPDLNEMYMKVCQKLQHDSIAQLPKEQSERLKMMKVFLERIISFLQVSKSNIPPNYKDKMGGYEKQIVTFLNSHRGKKPIPTHQGQHQLQPSGGQTLSIPQQQQLQSQMNPQMQPGDNQMNSQMQPINIQNPVASVQPTSSATSMPHSSLPPLSTHLGVPPTQGTVMGSIQSGSTLEMSQGTAPSLMQQGGIGSRQQNTLNSQQANMNTLSQSGVSGIQPNMNSLQLTSNILQQQHLKQQQEQLKHQFHQRQMHQLQQQKQQLQQQQQHPQLQQLQQQQQQQQQQQKQQQSSQFQAHQMPQLHQMSEDVKMRQGMGFKQGMAPQHHSVGQRGPYHHQQLKGGAQFPNSSPQLLPAASPQLSQHSPQIDQQSLLTFPKSGTPLQSANSPFIVPSPSTPLAPSPIPGDPEKQASGVSSLSNAGNTGHPQSSAVLTQAQSLAIGTPGISASPLLAEFPTDGNQATEQPLERLMKAVKSISPKAFSASVSDIGSVISMIDRIAGSAPGNGSRAAVGEDLVAMTKCRMQARNFITQDGASTTKKMRRDTSAMPLNVVSSAGSVNDSFKQLNGIEMSDLESTATSRIRRPRVEANHALLEEIKEINRRLIDTVVEINDEDVDSTASEGGQGTIIKCSYTAVALSPELKRQYASGQMSQILPLQLLVPTNYPNCSPVLLDKVPIDLSDSKDSDDLSLKTRLRFSISLRSLSQPMSLKEMVRTWDACTRSVITDYAKQSGGGTFSSRFGTWDKCVSAA